MSTPDKPLSERQKQILAMIAAGIGDNTIAAKLFITVNTVKSHKNQIRSKLGARNTPHAVAIAMRKNLLANTIDEES